MLFRHLEISPSDNSLVSDIKKAISSDLKPRYSDANILEFLLQTLALDPQFKSLPYLDDDSRQKVYSSIPNRAGIAPISQSEAPDETSPSENPVATIPTLKEGESPLKVQKEVTRTSNGGALADLFGDIFVARAEPPKTSIDMMRAELVSYKKEDCLPFNSEDGCEVSDPLRWWKAREDKYPLLSKHAKRLLGIPATSVASEQVFSTAGDVATAQRACLLGDQVDMLVFLKQNIIIPDDLFQSEKRY